MSARCSGAALRPWLVGGAAWLCATLVSGVALADEIYGPPVTVSDTVAMDLLNASDLKPTKPGSIGDALTDLRALVKDGSLVPGTALELNPWALGMGTHVDWDQYQRDLNAALLRSSLSVATTSTGSGATQVVQGAVGLRVRLWDRTDWRLRKDVIECLRPLIVPLPAPVAPPDTFVTTPTPPPPTPPSQAAIANCRSRIRWNDSQGALGGGVTSASPGGAINATQFNTASVWASFGIPLGDSVLLILSPRYTYQAALPAMGSATSIAQQHLYGLGMKLTYGWGSGAISLEGGPGARTEASGTEARGLVGISGQFEIGKDTWLELSFDGALDPDARSQLLGLSSIKWKFDVVPPGTSN